MILGECASFEITGNHKAVVSSMICTQREEIQCYFNSNVILSEIKFTKIIRNDVKKMQLANAVLSCLLLTLFSMSLSHTVTNGSSHSPTALNGAPSPPNGYSNGPSSSSSSSLANQQLPPACGARQLSKLKRFLTTLQQFGNDISPEIGERVRTLVLGLVVRTFGVCELDQCSQRGSNCLVLLKCVNMCKYSIVQQS